MGIIIIPIIISKLSSGFLRNNSGFFESGLFLRSCRNFSVKREIDRMGSHVIAAVQMTCTADKEKNFEKAKFFIEKAVESKAKVVFLPEAFDFLGRSKEETATLAETIDGPLIQKYSGLAKQLRVWLSLGGCHEKLSEIRDDGLPWLTNNHILINDAGEVVASYRKAHLFDVSIPSGGINLTESSYVKPGKELVTPVDTPVGRIGLGVCYDIRFPEFSSQLRLKGAEILTYPSAFTVVTGKAHWEILLRARAIETQCYVIAAAQVGKHNEKRTSYGHSLIIDPWGKILAEATEDVETVITAEINRDELEKIRQQMPVINHRRTDLYTESTKFSFPDSLAFENDIAFGQYTTKKKFVFLESNHSYAMVNRKCIVPGHVLVIPKRVALRFADLTSQEVADLFSLAQKVEIIGEEIHSASSSCLIFQDGPDAGRTVSHLHLHIIPRVPGDFIENNDIYRELQKHDKVKNDEHQEPQQPQWRPFEEMEAEANLLRNHVRSLHQNWLL